MRNSGFAVLVACALAIACDNPTEPEHEEPTPSPASLNLREGVVRLLPDDSARLTADVRDANYELLTDAIVTWSTDDPLIATVDANGKVTATGVGWTMIRAQSGTFTDHAWVSVSLRFKSVSAGRSWACGISTDNAMLCWGSSIPPFDPAGTIQAETPRLFSTDARTFVAGWDHGCWMKADQTVWCWGRDHHGQRGDGSTFQPAAPTQVLLPQPLISISSKQHHTCGVTADERVFCWGINDTGEVGIWPDPDGFRTDGCTYLCRSSPVEVPGVRLRMVSAGLEHTCGLDAEGAPTCWGANETGQLGIGVVGDTLPPQRLSTPLRFKTIDAGYSRTCAISSADELYCWGQGVVVPTRIDTTEKFQSVSVMTEICAVTIAGKLYCLRNGVMTPLTTDVVFRNISRNINIGCALSIEGGAYCMGVGTLTGTGVPYRDFPVMVAPPGVVPTPAL